GMNAPAATIEANGETTQEVVGGDDVETFGFSWTNALSMDVQGLPDGLAVEVDENQNTATISGRPSESGVFEFTVATVGGVVPAYATGSITVEGDVPISLHKLQANQGLSVFPNPFGDHLGIISELKEMKSIDIYTYD